MQNDYHSDRILNKLKEYRKLYEPELSEHFSRWPSSGGQKTWLKDLAKSEHFARSRSFYMKTHLQEFFGLDSMHFAEGAFPKACVVFPNPVRDLLIIEFADLNRNFHGLELYDIFGRQVRKLELEPDHRAYPVSVLELPEGMYLLRLVSDSEDLVERITVLD
jgi:hypothetical protein